jgi:hypothetical protein
MTGHDVPTLDMNFPWASRRDASSISDATSAALLAGAKLPAGGSSDHVATSRGALAGRGGVAIRQPVSLVVREADGGFSGCTKINKGCEIGGADAPGT